MNKSELITDMSFKTGLSKAQTRVARKSVALESMIDTIAQSLKDGEDVQILGFGSFSVSRREARMGRSPQTGAPVEIQAKNAARFKPGKTLKDKINA